MKTLIIYYTKHGATKQYVSWISEQVKADVVELKDAEKVPLSFYDKILIGSPIYAGNIEAADFVNKKWAILKDKKVGFFTVSGYEADGEKTKTSYENSFSDEVKKKLKGFHLRGKLILKELGIFERIMLKIVGVKEINGLDKAKIKPIVEFLKRR